MIIFNTIKNAEHYVKWCNKTKDYNRGGYDWESYRTFISGKYVLSNLSGDGCGCGCDTSRYSWTTVLGRIKQWNVESTRQVKIERVIS